MSMIIVSQEELKSQMTNAFTSVTREDVNHICVKRARVCDQFHKVYIYIYIVADY